MSDNKHTVSRRDLFRAASIGAVGLGSESLGLAQDKPVQAPKTEDRNKNKSIPRRRLGRTNMMVTIIGSGAGAIQDSSMIHSAIDAGINYFDTAPAYGRSETLHGEVMKERRSELFLATKWWPKSDWSTDRCLESLERSLKALNTDYVDLMQVHSLDISDTTKGTHDDGFLRSENSNLHKAMEIAKKNGKVRYFGVSSHNPSRKDLLKHAIDTGKFDTILVAFNYMNYEQSGMPELLEYAKKHDIGVIGMKSGAGNIKVPNVKPRSAQMAWVLSKDIHTVINTGVVTNQETLAECVAAAKVKIAQLDRDTLERYASAVHNEYCRGCSHICETACPATVRIGDILRFEMYHRHYGEDQHEFALSSYNELSNDERVLSVCADCRKCETACPYDIPIVDKLHYVDRVLA